MSSRARSRPRLYGSQLGSRNERAPRGNAATNSPENPGDTGRIYGRARTGNFRAAAGTMARWRREEEDSFAVDAHHGTCKFIRQENTSSTIEKSPACNGRFSLIGSSGHLDETCSCSMYEEECNRFLRHAVWYTGGFFLTFVISSKKGKNEGADCFMRLYINSLFCTIRISLDLKIHIFADR